MTDEAAESARLEQWQAQFAKLVIARSARANIPDRGERIVGWRLGSDAVGTLSEQLACIEAVENIWASLPDLLATIRRLREERDEARAEAHAQRRRASQAEKLHKQWTEGSDGLKWYMRRLSEAQADARLWQHEAEQRSETLVQCNLDRAFKGVEAMQQRERAQTAEAQLAEAREALRPFAELDPPAMPFGGHQVQRGVGADDLRRARIILTQESER